MQASPLEQGPGQTPTRELITCGPVSLDPPGWSATVNGRLVQLTVSEFLVLQALVLNASRFLDRAALDQVLAGAEGFGLRERSSLRSVDIVISRLRRKLHAAGCDAIQTLRQVGYRFVPTVEPAAQAG